MTMIFANMALANQSAHQYFEGEFQSLERTFSVAETQMKWSFEHRKASTNMMLNSNENIKKSLQSIGKHNLKASLTLAVSSEKVSQAQLKPLIANEADRTGRLEYSKAEMIRLQKLLKKKSKNLKRTLATIKKQMGLEILAQTAKAAMGFATALLSFGLSGNPQDAIEEASQIVELIEKLVKIIAKLSDIIRNIVFGIIESASFKKKIKFEEMPTVDTSGSFMDSVKQAYDLKQTKQDFDYLRTKGQNMYDDIKDNTQFVDAGLLKEAIFGLVDTGRDFVAEVSFLERLIIFW